MQDFLDKNINADEIEIRIGEFKNKKFIPYVSESKYNYYKDLEIIDSKTKEKKSYEIHLYNIGDKVYREYEGIYELKTKLGTFDVRNMNMRVSASNEERVNKVHFQKNKKVIKKERESYKTLDKNFRFDFEKVEGKYRVEVEYIGNSISKVRDIIVMISYLYANELKYNFWGIVNKPISLNRETVYYLKKGYTITEKTDGERVLVMITEPFSYEISSTSIKKLETKQMVQCKNVPFPYCLLDCEKVNETYYAFDILNNCYFSITNKDLRYRYEQLKKVVKEIKLEREIKVKEMIFDFESVVKEVKKIYNKNFSYHIDGIIFTPIKGRYKDYKWPILKWKPLRDLTIDFLVKVDKKDIKLYCKDKGPKLFETLPLQSFTKKEKEEMNDKIVEFYFDKTWKLYRIREDKTKEYKSKNEFTGPNHCHVCYATKNIINHPIEINNLNKNVYYKNRNETHMRKLKRINNKIKSYMIEKYVKEGDNVLDIGGGRGGDIMKYRKQKVKNIVLIDKNEGGIVEARRRFPKNNFKSLIGNARENINIEGEYDIISCQFMIHYMLGSKKEWETFFKNFDKVVKKGGIFMASYLDGETLYKKLEDKIEYKGNNNKTSIFTIEKLYQGKLKDYGQEIKVISENFGEVNEYLVNNEFLLKYFEDKGYECIENKFFKEIMKGDELSKGEREYYNLERFLVIKKK